MSSKYFGRQLELPLLKDLGRVLVVVLALYGILRLQDLYHRGVLHLVLVSRYEQRFFLLEICAVGDPAAGAAVDSEGAKQRAGTLSGSGARLAGIRHQSLERCHHRRRERASGGRYSPKWTEVVITAMFVALGFAIFGFAARYLPIFPMKKRKSPLRVCSPQADTFRTGGTSTCRRLTNSTPSAT